MNNYPTTNSTKSTPRLLSNFAPGTTPGAQQMPPRSTPTYGHNSFPTYPGYTTDHSHPTPITNSPAPSYLPSNAQTYTTRAPISYQPPTPFRRPLYHPYPPPPPPPPPPTSARRLAAQAEIATLHADLPAYQRFVRRKQERMNRRSRRRSQLRPVEYPPRRIYFPPPPPPPPLQRYIHVQNTADAENPPLSPLSARRAAAAIELVRNAQPGKGFKWRSQDDVEEGAKETGCGQEEEAGKPPPRRERLQEDGVVFAPKFGDLFPGKFVDGFEKLRGGGWEGVKGEGELAGLVEDLVLESECVEKLG